MKRMISFHLVVAYLFNLSAANQKFKTEDLPQTNAGLNQLFWRDDANSNRRSPKMASVVQQAFKGSRKRLEQQKQAKRRLQSEAEEEEEDVTRTWDEYRRGIESCPCLRPSDPRVADVRLTNKTFEFLGIDGVNTRKPTENDNDTAALLAIDLSTYGFGCTTHDAGIPVCRDGCSASSSSTILPSPIDCDRSWCRRSWCWVDAKQCNLLHKRSVFFPTSYRYYSYATCWDMDSFTQNNRLGSLDGRVIKAGFNSNSGGWLGAYGEQATILLEEENDNDTILNPVQREVVIERGTHFKAPAARWTGPAVTFLIEAARAGHFIINLTEPPAFLKQHSFVYFGNSTSQFDFCVYAASLGYLDICIAQYTVTDKRAATTDWILLGSQDVNLVVHLGEARNGGSDWQRFLESTRTIFKPFTTDTWVFVIFLVIPLLSGLMVVHEYGRAGSAYPKTESVVETTIKRNEGPNESYRKEQEIKERKIPFYIHVTYAIYIGFLSVLQQSYSVSLVTYGAMIHLLGMAFFILTIIAVYTANLAAILTQRPTLVTVSGLDEAVENGLSICAERKTLQVIRALYPHIPDNFFVNDPVYLGGDGQPGFQCSQCQSRRRVFEMVQPQMVARNDSFCHVALAPLEDLEVEQQDGSFCELGIVGDAVGQVQTGMPVYEGVSSELISLLLKLKNEGVYQKEVLAARPESQCPSLDEGVGEGSALSIQQLTGIWVVTFGFALAGLAVTFLKPRIERRRKKKVQSVIGYDQSGQRINVFERSDSWIHSKTVAQSSRHSFLGRESSSRSFPQNPLKRLPLAAKGWKKLSENDGEDDKSRPFGLSIPREEEEEENRDEDFTPTKLNDINETVL